MTEQNETKRSPGRPKLTLGGKEDAPEVVQEASNSESAQPAPYEVPADILAEAVRAEVAALLPSLTAQIAQQVLAASPVFQNNPTDATSIISGLANQLAELTRQNDGTPYVSPEDQTKRRLAAKKLVARLDELCEAVEAGQEEAPVYTLTAQIQDSDLGLIDPEIWEDKKIVSRQIASLRIPNEAMKPVNATAKEVHALFLESIGTPSGTAHHKGMLRDSSGKLMHMKTREGLVGGPDHSTPTLDMERLERAKSAPSLALIGRGPDAAIERVNILGTIHEAAKMQRL